MLELGTHWKPRSSWRSSAVRVAGGAARTGGRSADQSRPAARRCASATRYGVAARQWDRTQAGRPLVAVVVGDQHLPAPDGPVGPIPGAVEGEPDDALA